MPDPQRNILVSGASGVVGYGILRSLRKSGRNFNLVGTTIHEDSVAQGFCDVFELAPKTDHPDYTEWLKGIIRKHNIHFLIPGIEADVYHWINCKAEFETLGAKALLNNPELVGLCKDKWLFYNTLIKRNERFAIPSSLQKDYDALVRSFGLPFLLKPRMGYGSQGILRIGGHDDFIKHQDKIGEELMVQPIVGVETEEYTTSAFCNGSAGYLTSMTLRRRLSKDGFTERAEVVDMKEINAALIELSKTFEPIGPTNFQFRRLKDALFLLEINPRVSSSTSIRTAFGYNECLMAIDYFLDGVVPTQPLIKRGRAVRYWEDFIFYETASEKSL